MPETLTENGSIYVTKKKIYKTIKNRLGGKISRYTMDNYTAFEVDTKNDLKFFSVFLKPEIRKIFNIINPKKTK
jgi:CMP-N-acetylneuraminic acid synthetase